MGNKKALSLPLSPNALTHTTKTPPLTTSTTSTHFPVRTTILFPDVLEGERPRAGASEAVLTLGEPGDRVGTFLELSLLGNYL